MAITVQSFTQSDYGVGNTGVSYVFNLTVPMTSSQPQLAITVPPEVNFGNVITGLSFYGTVQNAPPVIVSRILVFSLSVTATNATNPHGYIFLNLTGMTNPQYIGNSSNFAIQLMQTLGSSQCVGCIIAQVYGPLFATSTTAGNIITISLTSSVTSISQANNLSIYTQLFAPIPVGGMFQILLPPTVTPTQPLSCINTYGFTLTNGTFPICGYNSTINAIYTSNFAYPNFVGSATALIQISINNPPDSRNSYFSFQTYDSSARLIGSSSTPFLMNASPLVLAATATKTSSQVQSSYTLAISLTIQVAISASNYLQVILPQANYNQTNIVCISSGINLHCTNSLDNVTGNLTLSMPPPCSSCSAGATLSLNVTGLNNPSFINNYTQNIIVQTASSSGIIEFTNIQLLLSPSSLSISNYLRNGPLSVGSNYFLSFNFVVPNYVVKNGGQIVVSFNQFDTYINPVYSPSDQTYSYPQSLNISDSSNNSLQNSISYFSTNSPNSVQEITVQICTGISCPSSLTIYGLRRALTVVSGLVQNIVITTLAGDQIASNNFTIMNNPTKITKALALSLSNSVVAANSNYIINFVSNLLPFQSGLTLTLPSQIINGGCFVTDNSTILGYSFSCTLVTNSTISITYSGDPTLMMIENINYTLTITSVTNPPSTQPLLYSMSCSYNSVVNQQFALTYAIQNPYPLTLSYSKNNNTLGQSAVLSLSVTSLYPNFDQLSLSIPTGLLTVQSSSNYQYSVVNNSYFLSGIYSLTNNSTSINILNPTSTGTTGYITFNMYVSNYFSAQGTVFVNPVSPVFLSFSASVSSQVVGVTSQLALAFTRVTPFASEISFNLNISSLLFNCASAQYNGVAVTFPLSVPIGVTSILITNLQNLEYIPNSFNAPNALQGWTFDSTNNVVAYSSYNVTNILPNTPISGASYTFVRNNTSVNGIGSLTVSYTPTYPNIQGYMTINMPINQTVIASPGCTILSGTVVSNCMVSVSNSTSITLQYSGQISTTLTGVLNSEPNANQLQILMWTSKMELVEFSQGIVTPPIQYNSLTISGSATSSLVATASSIQISVVSSNPIAVNSKLIVNFPSSTFTNYNSAFSQDCKYTIQSLTYTGCQWSLSGGWISQANISYLGSSILPANTTILITFPLANNWTSTPFLNTQIIVYLSSSQGYSISQGILPLTALYNGLNALIPATIIGLAISQTSLSAGSTNNIVLSFSVGVPVTQGTTINVTIQKSAYSLNSSDPSLTNLSLISYSQNSTFYILSLGIGCTQTAPVCLPSNSLYSIALKISNNPYVKYQQDIPNIIVLTGSLPVSSSLNYSIPMYSPQQLTLSSSAISRSNKNAYQPTTVTINIPNPNIGTSFTLAISPLLGASPTLSLVNSISAVGNGQSSNYTYVANSSNFINVLINIVGSNNQFTVLINGTNNLLVPINTEIYGLNILDGTYIYYCNNVTPSDTLIPYSSGVSLQRIITTVSATTNIYMLGSLPISVFPMNVLFNGNIFSLSNQAFNLSLGTYINSNLVTNNSLMHILIQNNYYTAFSSSLPITPSLTAQNLTAFLGLNIPNNMVVNQNVSLALQLNPSLLSNLSLKLPPFFTTLIACCIDPSCTQSKITNCSLTITPDNLNFVQVILNGMQTVSTLTLTVKTVNYQTSYTNFTVNIYSALPSASISYNQNISVSAAQITSSLSLASWKVNSLNNYTLTITPINTAGNLNITIPNFLSSQLTPSGSPSSYTLTINNITTPTSLTSNSQSNYSFIISLVNYSVSAVVILTINSVINPPNNQSFNFTMQQSQSINGVTQIYSNGQVSFAMNQFDTITISSAIRNPPKVDTASSLTLVINTPNYSDSLIISLPSSQMYFTGPNCQINLNSSSVVPCQYLNSNSILTSNLPGTYEYIIVGFTNQISFNANTQYDLVQASLGSPFTRALTQSNTTTYISPRLTVGMIVFNSLFSSNPNLLQTTTLTYNFTLQNWNSINGIIIDYGAYFYIIPPNVQCTVNGVSTSCSAISTNSLFITVNSPTQQNIIVISNLINYVKVADWTLRSVITSISNNMATYSDVDLYYNDGTNLQSLVSSAMSTRLILANNYVQPNASALIIIDTVFSQYIALNTLQINVNSQGLCTPTNFSFTSTLTLSCSFTQSTSLSITLSLFYTGFPSVTLATSSSSLQIYPQTTTNCTNQMCDLCSSINGQEYCFSCREGLVSSNGQCQSSCSGNQFPYGTTNICEPCFPNCANCYGLYSNDCLSCANSSQVLNSGTCQNTCPSGTYSYNNFCVNTDECDISNGCRVCSNTGFCYQCLPDYEGEPSCSYVNSMPPTLMIYILIPFLLIGIIPILIALFRCLGFDTFMSQTIFGFSTIQLFAWILAIPIMPNISTSMTLLSLLLLRIIISIVSYEVFYKKNMGQLSQILLEEESQKEQEKKTQQENTEKSDLNNWKTKLTRITAHFNGPDSYELLKSQISPPVLTVSHSNLVQVIFFLNRVIVIILMIYMLSIATIGDSIYIPLASIIAGSIVSVCRLLSIEKVKSCLSRLRS